MDDVNSNLDDLGDGALEGVGDLPCTVSAHNARHLDGKYFERHTIICSIVARRQDIYSSGSNPRLGVCLRYELSLCETCVLQP